jgi:hypothetical protein
MMGRGNIIICMRPPGQIGKAMLFKAVLASGLATRLGKNEHLKIYVHFE